MSPTLRWKESPYTCPSCFDPFWSDKAICRGRRYREHDPALVRPTYEIKPKYRPA